MCHRSGAPGDRRYTPRRHNFHSSKSSGRHVAASLRLLLLTTLFEATLYAESASDQTCERRTLGRR